MGDSQAALFANRCFEPGQAKVTLGTGSSILLNTGSNVPPAGIRTIAWTRNGRPTYCSEGVISCTGAVITWLRDQLGLIRSPEETESAAIAVKDNGGVYFVPAFTGLSSPHWSCDARAAIVGLSASSTRNHVVRAALESIAYQIKDALEFMMHQSQTPLTEIHADGGGSNNSFLVQFIADLLGTKVTLNEACDSSPLGAARSGMLG
jgi:glycerol kinase